MGLGFEEICDGDAVADRGDEESVVRNDDVSTSVRSSQEVLESEIHDFCRGGHQSWQWRILRLRPLLNPKGPVWM